MSIPPSTEPNLRTVRDYRDPGAPPRFLLIGVVLLFFMIVGGIGAGILVFREVLLPSQQQRVIDVLPFMRALMRPTPVGGTLPTVEPDATSNQSALDLLNMPVGPRLEETPEVAAPQISTASPTAGEPTPEPLTPEPTSVSAIPTATLTPEIQTAPATPTNQPPIPTDAQIRNASAQQMSPIPLSARMFGFVHQQQSWNNCGPATITMAMSYFGWRRDQEFAKDLLRPNREDKNVTPEELARYVNEQSNLRAIVRMGGTIQTLKRLIANNFPVVIERGIMFEANDWLGHYQALVAYDDTMGVFYAYDSFMGTGEGESGVAESYIRMDADWRAFNRTFIVLFLPEAEGQVRAILGDLADETGAAQTALATAQDEARRNPQDPFAWFNMGTSLVALERYREAANAFDQARRFQLPWRMTWYQFGPFVAYYNEGRYDDVLSLVQINLNNAQELEESYYWRGRVYLAQGQAAQAAAEFRRALSYNPNYEDARRALQALG